MLRNYLKIAFRHLLKNKGFSFINITGLALGLATVFLIALWMQRELNMNQFHANRDRLFRIMENQTYGSDIFTFSATPGPLAQKLKDEFPEIQYSSRASWGDHLLFTKDSKSFYENGMYVDPDFLRMFSFPVIAGDTATLLQSPDQILISCELASKYFPAGGAIGQTLELNKEQHYSVSGIFEDVPKTSSFQFDFLLPVDLYVKQNGLDQWSNNSLRTYFMTRQPMETAAISARIKDAVRSNGRQDNVDLLAQSIHDWYLRTDYENGVYAGGGRIRSLRLFRMIALFILLMACINFMNLSTAGAATRAKEVGIRKVSGAGRTGLAGQFLGESLMLTLFSTLLALLLLYFILPTFNTVFDLDLQFNQATPAFKWQILAIVMTTGLLAGSYPALMLSGFRPIQVLKGIIKSDKQAVRLRKGLVVAQFVIAVFLIIGTLGVYRQIEFIRHQQLGYNRENLMYFSVSGTLWVKYQTDKNEWLSNPEGAAVSPTSQQIHNWGNNTSDVNWPGKDPEISILFQTIPVEHDFLKTIGAELVEGRDFSPEFPSDTGSFIINETAAQIMGLQNPIGQRISLWGQEGQIVGLAKDFHVGSFRSKQDPVLLFHRPWKNFVYLRLTKEAEIAGVLPQIEAIVRKHNPAYPFDYAFTDEQYDDLHRSDILMGQLARLFTILAVIVSCLGLLGLATFSAQQRTKEIGIRKVLGAGVPGIIALLSKDFLGLVVIAIVLAAPIAWYFMDGWLDNFAYHIEMPWDAFGLAALIALGIAFLTVSFQSIRAALADPVKSLRSE